MPLFWILRTGTPWRDFPPSGGDGKNPHRRLGRWRDQGVWARLPEALIDYPEFALLMLDTGHVKIHAPAVVLAADGGNQDLAKAGGGSPHQDTSGRGCAWRAGQSPCKDTTADCKQAESLIDGLEARGLPADRGDDSDQMGGKSGKSRHESGDSTSQKSKNSA